VTSEDKQFEAGKALKYAASIAKPRLVGTAEHDRVADELAARLAQWGYHVEREPFEFSTALNALLALILSINGVGLSAILLIQPVSSGAAIIGTVSLVGVVLVTTLIGRSISRYAVAAQNTPMTSWCERIASRLGKHYAAMNLVATLPPDNQPRHTLYLVAHYDSKSQRWPLMMRIALFSVLIPGTLVVLAATLPDQSSIGVTLTGLVAVVASGLLALLGTGNASPGAIDNASGVGLVLHLAENLAARSDWRERLRVIVLLTSAEEVGLMGATAYVKHHAVQLKQDQPLVLNFDGIGVDGELQWVGAASSELAKTIQKAARDNAIPIGRFRFIGALFDHIPFAQHGLDAVSLITVGRASRSIHTRHDTIEHLHVRGFEQAGQVALQIIEHLAISEVQV